MIIGYARDSANRQSLDVQLEDLTAAGCERVFCEKQRQTAEVPREVLETVLDFVREGDVLVVTRLDRLARSCIDLQTIVTRLHDGGAGLRCLQDPVVDTTAAQGELVLKMLSGMAEFEQDLKNDCWPGRVARRVYTGRSAKNGRAEIRELHAQGQKPLQIARRLSVAPSTVYRALKEGSPQLAESRDISPFEPSPEGSALGLGS